jgi:anti-sigma factor RsiW
MSAADRCEIVQGRLSDALLAREAPAPMDRDHAGRCPACGAHARDLEALAEALAGDAAETLAAEGASDALVAVTLARARAELSRREAARAAPLAGFRGELGRLVGLALLPLPLVLLWNAAVLGLGGELLAGFVPHALLRALGAGYVLAGVTWLACLYGSLPVLAHRQLRRRAMTLSEVPT